MPKLDACLEILIPLFIMVFSCSHVTSKMCGKVDIIYPFHVDEKWQDGDLHDYKLVCDINSTTFMTLGHQQYEVLSLNAEEIRINPLTSAPCSLDDMLFFSFSITPYRISPCNMLQLYGCNTTCHLNCSIPMPESYSNWSSCMKLSQPPCCESLERPSFYNQTEFPDFTRGSQTLQNYSSYFQCTSFISWAYSTPDSTLSFHADFGLKLQWYLRGNCSCSSNASCRRRQGEPGLYTCQCNQHYIGDGYLHGTGCHPAGKLVIKSRSPVLNAILTSGVIAAATILGAAVVVGAVLFRRKKDSFPSGTDLIVGSYRKGDVNGLEMLMSGMELFTYKQLDKATKGFASSEKLGNGACGAVYSAKLDDGRRVAVKRLHHFNTHLGYQQTINELSVLSTVKHRNLVRLLGCCTESFEPLLVFEYVSNGTLAEHLQRERGDGLDWFTRLTIAAETADALAYLHAMDPQILHRDVKSRNILLDHDFNTKVADFGLSRMGPSLSSDGSHISTIPQGTPGYLDPDYHQNFHLSDKSDVYSFGVVLIEIITALKPVDFAREKKEVNLAALAVAKIGAGSLDDIIDKSLQVHTRPGVKAMVQRMAELAFRCLAYDKDARPSMREVLEELLLIRGSASSPLADRIEDDCASSVWMDAQSSQQHDSSFSLSSSDGDQLLLVRPKPLSQSISGVTASKDDSSDNV